LRRPSQGVPTDMRAHTVACTTGESHSTQSTAFDSKKVSVSVQCLESSILFKNEQRDTQREANEPKGAAPAPRSWNNAVMSAHTLLSAGGHGFRRGNVQQPADVGSRPGLLSPRIHAVFRRSEAQVSPIQQVLESFGGMPRLQGFDCEGAAQATGQGGSSGTRGSLPLSTMHVPRHEAPATPSKSVGRKICSTGILRQTLANAVGSTGNKTNDHAYRDEDYRENIKLHEKLMQCRQVLSASKVCYSLTTCTEICTMPCSELLAAAPLRCMRFDDNNV
jgi:hypothetical protein